MAGKKRGSSRQRKRADVAFQSTVEDRIEQAEEDEIVQKSEAGELFVLDTEGDTEVHRKIVAVEKARRAKAKKRPEVQVQNLLKKHNNDADALRAIAEKKNNRLSQKKTTNFDLWDNNDLDNKITLEVSKSSKSKAPAAFKGRSLIAVDLPHGGQSYKPDKEQHQDVIGEALAIELRRNEAVEDKRTPAWNGMSEQTLAILATGDDDSSSDEEDSEIDGNSTSAVFHVKKKQDKLTRAQRNKQKRVKAEKARLADRKRMKQFLHQVNESKKISKEVLREQREKMERRDQIKKLQDEKLSQPLGSNILEKLVKENPIKAPALPVALSIELDRGGGSTLRTVKTKGNLIHDRLHSMADRKMVNKQRPKRKVTQGKKRMKPGKGREYLLL